MLLICGAALPFCCHGHFHALLYDISISPPGAIVFRARIDTHGFFVFGSVMTLLIALIFALLVVPGPAWQMNLPFLPSTSFASRKTSSLICIIYSLSLLSASSLSISSPAYTATLSPFFASSSMNSPIPAPACPDARTSVFSAYIGCVLSFHEDFHLFSVCFFFLAGFLFTLFSFDTTIGFSSSVASTFCSTGAASPIVADAPASIASLLLLARSSLRFAASSAFCFGSGCTFFSLVLLLSPAFFWSLVSLRFTFFWDSSSFSSITCVIVLPLTLCLFFFPGATSPGFLLILSTSVSCCSDGKYSCMKSLSTLSFFVCAAV